MAVDYGFTAEFDALFEAQGIDRYNWSHISTFDEVPVYSRYQQLDFMAGLGYAEINRQLIRASACLLQRVVSRMGRTGSRSHAEQLLFMVSITDWHGFNESGISVCNEGGIDYVVPNIYAANLYDERMAQFDVFVSTYPPALRPPRSGCAEFVASALDRSSEFLIYESPEYDWCPERVYIRLSEALPRPNLA